MDLSRPSTIATSYPAIERARAGFDAVVESQRVQAVHGDGEVAASVTGPRAQGILDAVEGALQYAHDTDRLSVITNRHLGGVLDMLRGNEALRTGNAKVTYASNERRAGIRLPGAEDVPVNYGLLHVRPEIEQAETLEKVPNMGQPSYGQIALVLKPSVLDRSTLTEADSIDVRRTYPPEGMVNATAAALLRRAEGAEPYLSHNVGQVRSEWLARVLTGHPTAEQMSIALAQAPMAPISERRGLPPVPEVQVYGGITPADVASIRVQDGAPKAALAELTAAAAAYNIAVERGGPADTVSRLAWLDDIKRGGVRITKAREHRAWSGEGWDELADLWKPAVKQR